MLEHQNEVLMTFHFGVDFRGYASIVCEIRPRASVDKQRHSLFRSSFRCVVKCHVSFVIDSMHVGTPIK